MASSSTSKILGPDSHEETLLEFRAGKMTREGNTVKPDLRKGLCRLLRGEGFLRVQWQERTLDSLEDDILVFPHEANYEKVQQSSGRVYILKFKNDDRKYFFWMQEPNEKSDDGICRLVDFYLNPPPESDDEEEEPAYIFETVSQDSTSSKVKVLPKDGSMPGSINSMPAVQGPVQFEDLQRILSSINSSGTISGALQPRETGPSLTDILKPELVVPLLENCHLEERLAPFLPEGTWTREAILELMQSPQFHQQVNAFTHVLESGQIDLAQFGIDSSKYNFTVSSFLEAIEDQVAEKPGQKNGSTSEGTDSQGDKGAEETPPSKNDPMEEGS